MTTYYVGPGGNDGSAGTSWGARKLTLNGAENIPVAAGDTVYVGPGVYRETLTVDVSGESGSPITYIGDYSGQNTDGVGGEVRITGSNDDKTATRVSCIAANDKDYRVFRGFAIQHTSSTSIDLANSCTNITIDQCFFQAGVFNSGSCISIVGASQAALTVTNCVFMPPQNYSISITHSASINNVGHVIQNCIFLASMNGAAVDSNYVGGVTVANCLIIGFTVGVRGRNLSAGQAVTVNNSILTGNVTALTAGASGMIVEDYNSLYANGTARSNVSTGANSVAYAWLPDTRWFAEAVGGGRILSPFDVASYNGTVELNSGTGAPTADMRGTTVQGTYREWGPLEYDDDLIIEAGSSGGGGPVIGSRVIRGLGAI